MSNRAHADVLVVGTGPVGAVLALTLAREGVDVLMVEAGAAVSHPPGSHLRNRFLHQRDLGQYHDTLAAHLYPLSVTPPRRPLALDGVALPPQSAVGSRFNPSQEPGHNLPAAAACHAVGGMGLVWSGLAPRFDPRLERWDAYSAAEWEALYTAAEKALHVGIGASVGSVRQQAVIETLGRTLPGDLSRPPAPLPVAARRRRDHPGLVRWTGPSEVLAVLPEERRPRVLPSHVVRLLGHRSGRVRWAEAQGLDPWRRVRLRAEAFVVAAGAVHTPQLLWTSGILRGETSPLGRYFCEHPIAHARIVLAGATLDRVRELAGTPAAAPIPDGDPEPFVTVPLQPGRPFHSVILGGVHDRRMLEGSFDERLLLNLYWYARLVPRRDNLVSFHDDLPDIHGMPSPTFRYVLDDADRNAVRRMREDLRRVAEQLGSPLPGSPPQVLAPGSSMHYMGTVRMGPIDDDAESVVDPDGRVRGFDNLYAGGTGVVPSASASNPTLTACAVAVRTAHAILRTGRSQRRVIPGATTPSP